MAALPVRKSMNVWDDMGRVSARFPPSLSV
jgi:hypothetical protein